jgi:hypothetical protein
MEIKPTLITSANTVKLKQSIVVGLLGSSFYRIDTHGDILNEYSEAHTTQGDRPLSWLFSQYYPR